MEKPTSEVRDYFRLYVEGLLEDMHSLRTLKIGSISGNWNEEEVKKR